MALANNSISSWEEWVTATTMTLTTMVVDEEAINKAKASWDCHDCGCKLVPFDTLDRWLLGAVIVPVLVAGIGASVVAVSVFAKKQMRQQPTNWFLSSIAVFDAVFLVSEFCRHISSQTHLSSRFTSDRSHDMFHVSLKLISHKAKER